eukprot:m.34670 g.34670  ORF g.34670 m.34670 type:complete len:70 (-) comp9790_c0_seq1:169-378(-)
MRVVSSANVIVLLLFFSFSFSFLFPSLVLISHMHLVCSSWLRNKRSLFICSLMHNLQQTFDVVFAACSQ